MLEGLRLHEVLLMICGVLFFVTLLVVFAVRAGRKQSFKALWPFFLLPIAMIGFPSIQKISFDNGKVEIDKQVQALAADPTNAAAKTELTQALAHVESRSDASSASAGTLAALSRGRFALAKADPRNLRTRDAAIGASAVLVGRLTQPDYQPVTDPAARRRLEVVVGEISRLGDAPAEAHLELSKAYLALGDGANAKASLRRAKEIKPTLAVDPRFARAVGEP